MDEKLSYVVLVLLIIIGLLGFIYADSTGNGLKNYKEISNGANPLVQHTDNDDISDYEEIQIYDTNPRANDTSNNGLSDYKEIEIYGTDPNEKDTIGNGLSDYAEVEKYGTNPLVFDTDKDKLTDYEEVKLHATDPNDGDTDNDGLIDYNEANNYDSDPIKRDTDSDKLDDYQEVKVHGTDPTQKDTIGNNLTDYEEVEVLGTDPLSNDTNSDGLTDHNEVNVHSTDPLARDTTGDGLGDYKQVTNYGTDPTVNDTDEDDLSDYNEINLYDSDPLQEDTNGDGLTDYENINFGTDPTKIDSSGDGFLDAYGVKNEYIDPSKKSILVQVSYMEGIKLPRNELEEIESEFKNIPDSEYNLEFVIDEQPVQRESSITVDEYYNDYYDESAFTKKGEGYYHILAVPEIDESNIESSSLIFGATTISSDGIIVQERRNDELYAMTFAHELGHQLGLKKGLFDGIDSREYNANEYPSSMNYNWSFCVKNGSCGEDYKYTYSKGEGFDDWEHIRENFTSNQPSRINLTCSTEIDCIG